MATQSHWQLKQLGRRLAVVALGTALAAQAQAQDTGDDDDSESEAGVLEEIVVTARKREETLQDLPLSVTAFTAGEIEEIGLRDISELSFFTPGFSMQNISGGVEQPFIRGMSSTSFSRTEQTTSTFQDGVYSSALGRTVFFPDIERVEVIKGPQAALFGRATFAGAINYVTKQPTPEWDGMLEAEVGQNDLLNLHASVSGPITDNLMFRVSANSEEYEGEYINTLDGRPLGIQDRTGFGAWLTWLATEDLTVKFRFNEYRRRDDRQVPGYIQPSTTNNCFPDDTGRPTYYCGTVIIDESLLGLNLDRTDDGFSHTDQSRAVLEADWVLGDLTLTSVTGWVDQESSTWFDGDYTPVPVFGTLVNGTNENLTQEFRIASSPDRSLRWLAGVFYFNEESTSQLGSVNPSQTDIDNYAVFGSVEIDLSDQFTLSLDGRWQTEEQDFVNSSGTRFQTDTDAFLPRVILDFKPTDDVLYYASVSKGVQPARFNSSTNVPDDRIQVDEETIWSYEIGAKATLLGGRMTLDAAAYYIDWDDQAYRIEIVGNDGEVVNIFDNLGGTRIQGLELAASALLTDDWSLTATYAYIDAEYRDFESANAERVFGDPQVAGNQLPNTPEHQFSVSTRYARPFTLLEDGEWFVRGDYSWRDSQFLAEINQAETGDVSLLNLRGGVESRHWRVELAWLNALDEDSPEFATRFTDFGNFPFGFGYLIRLRPSSQVQLTTTYRF